MNKHEYKTHYKLEDTFWWFRGRRIVSFMLLNKYVNSSRNNKILDIGCGTGINLEHLKKYGNVYGLDTSKEALKFCMKRGFKNLKVNSAENLNYPDNFFDIITSFGVFCCVKNDFKALKEVYRVCKPKAMVMITSPAIGFLTKLKTEHDFSQHLIRRYDKREMKKSLEKVGFKIKRITYMNMFLAPLIMGIRIMKKILKPNVKKVDSKSDLCLLPSFINSVLFLIMKIECFIIKYFDLPIGLTLICIAEKTEGKTQGGKEEMKRTIKHEKELVRQIIELMKKEDIDGILDLVRKNKIAEKAKLEAK